MAELENVIKALKCCTHAKAPIPCDYCPYVGNDDYNDAWSCRIAVMKDALELLKEKKQGTWECKIYGKPESGGTCGKATCDQCGESAWATAVTNGLHYCPNCGAKMKNPIVYE